MSWFLSSTNFMSPPYLMQRWPHSTPAYNVCMCERVRVHTCGNTRINENKLKTPREGFASPGKALGCPKTTTVAFKTPLECLLKQKACGLSCVSRAQVFVQLIPWHAHSWSGLCNDTIIALLHRNYGTVDGLYRQNVKMTVFQKWRCPVGWGDRPP